MDYQAFTNDSLTMMYEADRERCWPEGVSCQPSWFCYQKAEQREAKLRFEPRWAQGAMGEAAV
jgi:hypothetical protein